MVNVWMSSKEYALLLGSRIWEMEREYVLGVVTLAPGIESQSTVTANLNSLAMRLSEIVVDRVSQISEYERQCIRFR